MKRIQKLKEGGFSGMFEKELFQKNPPKVHFIFTVTTGSMKFAGTDSNVYVRLTGASGEESSLVRLDNTFRDDFERGSVDRFRVKLEDIGIPVILTIKHDDVGMFSDWYVVSVTVQKEGEENRHKFFVNSWVVGTVHVVEEAKHPRQEENPVVISFHKKELARMKCNIKWRNSDAFLSQVFPGCILAQSLEDLPRSLQLEAEMMKDFEGATKSGKYNVAEKISGIFSSIENVGDIKNLFLQPKLPKIPDFQQNWERDEEFGRQMMNGCNPTILKRCRKIPAKFPVTHAMVASQLTRGFQLNEEVERGNIFIIDLHVLEGVCCGKSPFDGCPYYSCAPLCLLYLNNKKQLVPIAIQLGQKPGPETPIWTPEDSESDWLLAKIYFRNAESNVQLIVEKIFMTHFVLEPFLVACCRCLSSRHPVLKLILPHLRYVSAGNMVIRTSLLNPGGVLDKLLSFGSGEHFRIIRSVFKCFHLDQLNIEKLMKENGVSEQGSPPGYHFRDDALVLWERMKLFVGKVLNSFYANDQEVVEDHEVQAFIKEVKEDGFSADEQATKGVPDQISGLGQLVDLVTSLMFTSSCRNASVTNGLFDVLINVPNAPLCMVLPPPTEKKQSNQNTIMRSLPKKDLSCLQISFCHSYLRPHRKKVQRYCCMIVSEPSHNEDLAKIRLADYPLFLFSEEKFEEIAASFRNDMEQFASVLESRNRDLPTPYHYLSPDNIPFAISL